MTMTNKRILNIVAIVLTTVMTLSLLAGCASAPEAAKETFRIETTAPADIAETVKIGDSVDADADGNHVDAIDAESVDAYLDIEAILANSPTAGMTEEEIRDYYLQKRIERRNGTRVFVLTVEERSQ